MPKSLAQGPQNTGRPLPRPRVVNTLIPMIKRFIISLIAVLAMTLSMPSLSSEWTFDNVDRVVAISDVHGAYEAMVRLA